MNKKHRPSPTPLSPTRPKRLRVAWALITLLASSLATPSTQAVVPQDLSTLKVFGKWNAGVTLTNYELGSTSHGSDLSPKWLAVGAPSSGDRGLAFEGAVHVYDAVTGKWLRKLYPPAGTGGGSSFGSAVAIFGDQVAVGAFNAASTRGQVFVYNLNTGALIRTFSATDGVANDRMGTRVAFSGDRVLASSVADDSNRGAVYVFSVASGLQVTKLTASDGAASDYLGLGLAVEGNLMAVSAFNADGGRGRVYFFDLSTLTEMRKFQPTASMAGDGVGSSISLHEGRMVVGCYYQPKAFLYNVIKGNEAQLLVAGSSTSYGECVAIHGQIAAVSEYKDNSNIGAVHLFDALNGAYLRTLLPPNSNASIPQEFGSNITLNGSTLLATAPRDSTQGTNAGAAYLVRPLMGALPYTVVATKGDYAPNLTELNYNLFGDVFVNNSGKVLFTSTLTGAASGGGKDVAVFTNVEDITVQKYIFRTRDAYSGTAKISATSRLSMNDGTLAIGLSTLNGTGVNAANNQALWYKSSTSQGQLIRTGTPFTTTMLTGTTPASIVEPVTSDDSGDQLMGAMCTLKVGAGGTSAVNDSALYFASVGNSDEAVREGSDAPMPLPAGSDLGQIAPRLAYFYEAQVFSSALTGGGLTTANNAAVYARVYGGSTTVIAQKGSTAVDGAGMSLPGVTYSAFIGESANGDEGALYRATLAGTAPAVTPGTNEGLWMRTSAATRRMAFRKGQTLGVAGGARIAKIVQYWYCGSSAGTSEVMALVQLAGTGVTAANDMALVLFQKNYSYNLLMREGEVAAGCTGARIGVISRVDVDAFSMTYALTATLTGANKTSDQALYCGDLTRGTTTDTALQRRPWLRLRKGQLFENQPSRVKSISLPSSGITPSGAGGTGRGRSIAWNGQFAFVVEFENGIRQVVRGTVF